MANRILVVDDQPAQRRSLVVGLADEGFEVREAADGPEALAVLQAEDVEVEVALIDLMMPGMNGVELAKRVSSLHAHVGIVLMSAYHLTEGQLQRIGLPMLAFVPKPFKLPEVVALLRTHDPPAPELRRPA